MQKITRQTHILEAKDYTLGRLATKIATLLQGKHKAVFTKETDRGDFVIVHGAKQIRLTGNKLNTKIYFRHTKYLGGLKRETLKEKMDKTPEWVIEKAVNNMLPKNRLRKGMMKRLKVEA